MGHTARPLGWTFDGLRKLLDWASLLRTATKLGCRPVIIKAI